MSTAVIATSVRAPFWPLFAAPFVAVAYYIALKLAFEISIGPVVANLNGTEFKFDDLSSMDWGTHWIYRLLSEILSTGLSVLVASGIARGRERMGAIISGITIAIYFLYRVGTSLYVIIDNNLQEYEFSEPWYQYAIEGIMVLMSPLIGVLAANPAREINKQEPRGFGGINRGHFLWLWLASYCYAVGLITPIARIYTAAVKGEISLIFSVLLNGIPAGSLLIPGYVGLALLSGQLGTALNSAARNLLGIVVIVVGFAISVLIQMGLGALIAAIRSALQSVS
jgi:hypothetical protein